MPIKEFVKNLFLSGDIKRVFNRVLDDVEREAIKNILERSKGNVSDTALFLGIERSTLVKKIKKLGLSEFTQRRAEAK